MEKFASKHFFLFAPFFAFVNGELPPSLLVKRDYDNIGIRWYTAQMSRDARRSLECDQKRCIVRAWIRD